MIVNWLSRNVLLFSCNTIGQLRLGGRGYSSHTVIPRVILNHTFRMMVYLWFFSDIHVEIFPLVSYSFTFAIPKVRAVLCLLSLLIETLVG